MADYIPALAKASPNLFGISVVSARGRHVDVGDADTAFSVQSVSKPFVFALVCDTIGYETARLRLGVNSTGFPFNSLMAVELNEHRTMNPLVNAGAIATTSLVPGETAGEKWQAIQARLSRFAGRELTLSQEVYESEASTNQRNHGIAHLLASYERIYFDPDEATDVYTRQCSLELTVHRTALDVRRALRPVEASDTLVTKVMLGVFGCVPAFDAYFKKGFGVSTFSKGSLHLVGEFYRAHAPLIDQLRQPTLDFATGQPTTRLYTRAKVVDMICFIEGGYPIRAASSPVPTPMDVEAERT